jgi:Zn-dependent peptidase ImmA (M78 family)
MLVPLDVLRQELPRSNPLGNVNELAHRFKVSTLVILRRIFDSGWIDWEAFQSAYEGESIRLRQEMKNAKGGNFHLTQSARVGRRFARALVADALEGRTLFRDAYQMLGIKKHAAFEGLGRTLGLAIR